MGWTYPSTHLLEEVWIKKIETSIQRAKILQCLGNILDMPGKYTEASEALTEAQVQFIKIRDPHCAAQCSQSSGNILHMQGKYTEASEALTEAQEQFIKIGDLRLLFDIHLHHKGLRTMLKHASMDQLLT